MCSDVSEGEARSFASRYCLLYSFWILNPPDGRRFHRINATSSSSQGRRAFSRSFVEIKDLPAPISSLTRISENFYWSWQPDGIDLFRELDPRLWIKYEQNPRLLLKNVRGLRLWQKAGDEEYIAKLNRFAAKFEEYLSEGVEASPSIAYFSRSMVSTIRCRTIRAASAYSPAIISNRQVT